MAEYSFDTPPRRDNSMVWNLLTLLMLLLSVCLAAYFALLLVNPYTSLNPFPPPTLVPTLSIPTPTPTLPIVTLPPTWTPTPPPPTPTPRPTWTPYPSPTPWFIASPTPTWTLTPAPSPTLALSPTPLPYTLQPGSPTYIPSNIWHPTEGCNYLGVAGQIFGANGQPLSGVPVAVQVGGTLADTPIQGVAIPGSAPHVGPSGFELMLADHPVASTGTLYIQVIDLNNQLPLSDQIFFDTRDNCNENIVLINFVQRP